MVTDPFSRHDCYSPREIGQGIFRESRICETGPPHFHSSGHLPDANAMGFGLPTNSRSLSDLGDPARIVLEFAQIRPPPFIYSSLDYSRKAGGVGSNPAAARFGSTLCDANNERVRDATMGMGSGGTPQKRPAAGRHSH